MGVRNVADAIGAPIAAGLFFSGVAYATEGVRIEHPTPEAHNAKVAACAKELGEHATVATQAPDDCSRFAFKTAFVLNGNQVTVTVPNKEATKAPGSEKVYELPSRKAFARANRWNPSALSDDREFVIGIGIGVALLGFIIEDSDRRLDKKARAAESSAPSAS